MTARFAVVVSAILLTGGVGAGEDKKDDKGRLQGEWTVVSAEFSGQKRDAGAIKRLKPLVIKGDEWTAPSGGTFAFKIDPTKKPKQLDLYRQLGGKEMVWRGIYKIEGDALTFCRSAGPDGERPTEFKGGKGVALLVFKRAGK